MRPQGVLENQLLELAASLLWRLRRIPALEVALFHWVAHHQAQLYDTPVDISEGDLLNDPNRDEPDLRDRLTAGRMFEAALSADLTSKLSRYETAMQRRLSATLHELERLQAPRRAFNDEVQKSVAKEKAKSRQLDPEDDPAYYAELDRKRMQRMGPP